MIQRYFLIIVFMVVFLPMSVMAQEPVPSVSRIDVEASPYDSTMKKIQIGDGVVTWQSGTLDPDSLNGDVRGVTVTADGEGRPPGEEFQADRLQIKTTPNAGGFTLDYLIIDGFSLSDNDGGVVTIDSITLTDGVIKGEGAGLRHLLEGEVDGAIGNFALAGLRIHGEGQQWLSLDALLISNSTVDGAAMDVPFGTVDMTVSNLVLYPDRGSAEYRLPEFDDFFSGLGTDILKADMRISGTTEDRGKEVGLITTASIDIDRVGRAELSLDIGASRAVLEQLQALESFDVWETASDDWGVDDWGIPEDDLFALLDEARFNEARLAWDDDGLIDAIIAYHSRRDGVSPGRAVDRMMGAMGGALGGYSPALFALLAEPIEGFLRQGGRLALSLNPPLPVPFASFLLFAAIPDAAITALGMSIEHEGERQ